MCVVGRVWLWLNVLVVVRCSVWWVKFSMELLELFSVSVDGAEIWGACPSEFIIQGMCHKAVLFLKRYILNIFDVSLENFLLHTVTI